MDRAQDVGTTLTEADALSCHQAGDAPGIDPRLLRHALKHLVELVFRQSTSGRDCDRRRTRCPRRPKTFVSFAFTI